MNWAGVMPAITTCFDADLDIDHEFMAKHCRWLLDNGCMGIVALGSLGEGATLSYSEKLDVLRTCVKAVSGRAPIIASISALSTSEATTLLSWPAVELGRSGGRVTWLFDMAPAASKTSRVSPSYHTLFPVPFFLPYARRRVKDVID